MGSAEQSGLRKKVRKGNALSPGLVAHACSPSAREVELQLNFLTYILDYFFPLTVSVVKKNQNHIIHLKFNNGFSKFFFLVELKNIKWNSSKIRNTTYNMSSFL